MTKEVVRGEGNGTGLAELARVVEPNFNQSFQMTGPEQAEYYPDNNFRIMVSDDRG